MEKVYDAIIIGAGNGGLATAATLACENKKVLLLEKHNIPGGCGTSFCRGRFEFEVALHQLSSIGPVEKRGPLTEQFKKYGFFDDVNWVEIESLYKVTLPDFEMAIPVGKEPAIEALSKVFPEDAKGIRDYYNTCFKFCEEADAMAAMAAKGGKDSALKRLIIKPALRRKFPTFTKYAMKSSQEVMDEFFTNKKLQACVSVYWCFMGMPPKRFPFFILAKCTKIYMDDKPYYLEGGSQVISNSLLETIRKNGGDVLLSTAALHLNTENGIITSVEASDGNTYKAKHIVSGISPIHTYYKLMDKKDVPEGTKEYLAPYKVGISAFTLFIGLDCKPEEVGFTDSFNLIYDNEDADESFAPSERLMPETDPIVTTCYTLDNPSGYPEGTSVITVGCLKYAKPWLDIDPAKYYDTKYKAADMLISRLEKHFPGIREHIEEMEVATPLTHMHYLDHPGGSIYGFEQDIDSTLFFFPNQSKISNLSFANGWVNVCGFGPNYMYGDKIAKELIAKGEV